MNLLLIIMYMVFYTINELHYITLQMCKSTYIMAAIFDFGGHIEIIKIINSSLILYLFRKRTFGHNIFITRLCKSIIINPLMFVLQCLAVILDFGGHIEIIKIIYSSLIRYLHKKRTF